MQKLDSGRREWLQEVHRIGEDQKAIRESAAVTGQQIEQIKTLTAQLEDKQAKLYASETKIERYEERLQALEDLMQGVDTKIDDVEKRQEAVDHVRLQVGNLFESTEKTRNDAMKVLEARQEIVDTKQKLELLLREASVLGNKYDGLEKQRETIDTAQTKMDRVTTVLEDIEANLENLKEQRTVVDHVAEKLARLDFALQRAEAATRELREERALASRIYKGIQKERASGSSKAAPAKPSAPKPSVAKTRVN